MGQSVFFFKSVDEWLLCLPWIATSWAEGFPCAGHDFFHVQVMEASANSASQVPLLRISENGVAMDVAP